jgi:hypothetical protein
MYMVGLMRGIKVSPPPRMMASVTLQLDIRPANTAISGTTGGPRTVSTRAWVIAGVGAYVAVGVAAGAGAIRTAGGAVAPRAYAACDAPTREGGARHAVGRDGQQVGLSTSSRSKICSKSGAPIRTGDDSIRRNQLVRHRPKYRTDLAS